MHHWTQSIQLNLNWLSETTTNWFAKDAFSHLISHMWYLLMSRQPQRRDRRLTKESSCIHHPSASIRLSASDCFKVVKQRQKLPEFMSVDPSAMSPLLPIKYTSINPSAHSKKKYFEEAWSLAHTVATIHKVADKTACCVTTVSIVC